MTSSLYEISMPGYEELKWYPIEVKRGKQTFQFEVYRSDNGISVYLHLKAHVLNEMEGN